MISRADVAVIVALTLALTVALALLLLLLLLLLLRCLGRRHSLLLAFHHIGDPSLPYFLRPYDTNIARPTPPRAGAGARHGRASGLSRRHSLFHLPLSLPRLGLRNRTRTANQSLPNLRGIADRHLAYAAWTHAGTTQARARGLGWLLLLLLRRRRPGLLRGRDNQSSSYFLRPSKRDGTARPTPSRAGHAHTRSLGWLFRLILGWWRLFSALDKDRPAGRSLDGHGGCSARPPA